ncbi:hypothetical protein C8R47DRAFT_759006 [Mycena vitilis]|nr:hypothetical protein C8R47DRAFT_759006 [Mycena vitilis]
MAFCLAWPLTLENDVLDIGGSSCTTQIHPSKVSATHKESGRTIFYNSTLIFPTVTDSSLPMHAAQSARAPTKRVQGRRRFVSTKGTTIWLDYRPVFHHSILVSAVAASSYLLPHELIRYPADETSLRGARRLSRKARRGRGSRLKPVTDVAALKGEDSASKEIRLPGTEYCLGAASVQPIPARRPGGYRSLLQEPGLPSATILLSIVGGLGAILPYDFIMQVPGSPRLEPGRIPLYIRSQSNESHARARLGSLVTPSPFLDHDLEHDAYLQMGNIVSALLSSIPSPPLAPFISASTPSLPPVPALTPEQTLPPELWTNIHRFVVSGILKVDVASEDPLNEPPLQGVCATRSLIGVCKLWNDLAQDYLGAYNERWPSLHNTPKAPEPAHRAFRPPVVDTLRPQCLGSAALRERRCPDNERFCAAPNISPPILPSLKLYWAETSSAAAPLPAVLATALNLEGIPLARKVKTPKFVARRLDLLAAFPPLPSVRSLSLILVRQPSLHKIFVHGTPAAHPPRRLPCEP